MKKRILFVTDWYRPGFRGGTIRAVANVVDRLSDRYDFRVITVNRDFRQKHPFEGIEPNVWLRDGQTSVYYLSPDRINFGRLATLIRESAPDVVALTTLFSSLTARLLLLRRAGALPAVPWLLAPHGVFSAGALRLKRWKKQPFFMLATALGLYRDIVWQAGSSLEVDDIRRVVPSARIELVPLLPPAGPAIGSRPPLAIAKRPGQATFLYLSSVTPKKNLRFVLEQLSEVRGDIVLDVIGHIDDRRYWESCLHMARTACPHVQLRHIGEVPHERVLDEIARRHFLILPTLGENFGFVVFEALACGRPVIISDRTPWRNLDARGAGWDLSLDDHAAWRRVLNSCVAMDDASYQRSVKAAWHQAIAYADTPLLEAATVELFERALAR